MLVFIFLGFLIGFTLALRFVGKPRRALIWGMALGGVPLALLLGPGNAPLQGIGSVLNFAFFALGPIMLVPFAASSAALGMAAASVVLWAGQGRARRVSWATGAAILGLLASLTLLPVAKSEITKHQLAENRETRAEAIIRSDFKGMLAGHQLAFPASPRLHLFDDCAPGVQSGLFGCSTSLTNPVSIFTKPDEVLLNERSDPIIFRTISVSATEHDCRPSNDYCLTQEKIDRWCLEIRPDQAGSIWCQDAPAMQFELRKDATPGPSDRDEPELAARYTGTVLGPGRVTCFYSPDPAETDRQGASCRLSFDLAAGVSATLGARREQITSEDPALTATIALIPDYWAMLAVKR
ncbi:hypothetical protein [Leisingera sp. ANG-Vp]|uniref:hypothetical protein n=1 Tax=Leisingera sp. ANG-Vp TaxID=1577896 RepID=UPI00057CD12E|nr:hypothetical protein [Leisingera sp. ANG-Vp]KIC20417.1 hypothetical protein RA20_08685 [Leisingera sp. ANG-Vp]